MDFSRDGHKKVTIHPKPNSLYIMLGECRRLWKHGMIGRKSDQGRTRRERRISATFRRAPQKLKL